MIGAGDLYRAQLDSIVITEETDSGGQTMRSAGIDPSEATKVAVQLTESYPKEINRLVSEGVPYEKALRIVLATTWCEGAAVGARAKRAELERVDG